MMSWGIILAGMAMVAAGLLFHMQGRGVVGPEQSFMYHNPEWLQYGMWIIASGVAVVVVGVIRRRRSC